MSRKKTTQKVRTENIFRTIEKLGYHPIDIEYGNGYFVFEHGEDMVIHFHIKECKGWKFGIWWNLEDKNQFDFFTQFEATIDKFKPSASTLVEEEISYDEDFESTARIFIIPILDFIKEHPYVAWSYDNGFAHKPWNYKSPFEAWKEYVKFSRREKKYKRVVKKVSKKWLKITKEVCDEVLPNYEILDDNADGWISYPRYHIVCKANGEGWFAINLEEVDKRFFKKAEKFDSWLEKLNKKGFHMMEVYPFLGEITYRAKKGDSDESRN